MTPRWGVMQCIHPTFYTLYTLHAMRYTQASWGLALISLTHWLKSQQSCHELFNNKIDAPLMEQNECLRTPAWNSVVQIFLDARWSSERQPRLPKGILTPWFADDMPPFGVLCCHCRHSIRHLYENPLVLRVSFWQLKNITLPAPVMAKPHLIRISKP